MARTPALADLDLDAVLRGEASTRDEQALEQLVLALRRDRVRHGAPPMSAALRAQIAEPAPVLVPPRRRLRLALAGVAGLLVGGATLGVAGAQDALPTPLQDATARAALIVGVDLPDSHEHGNGNGNGNGNGPASDGSSDKQGDEGTTSDRNGPPTTTKSGTQPADPGTPGDHEPATPATPGTADPNRGENGKANGSDNGTGPGSSNGKPNANGADGGTTDGGGSGGDDNSGATDT